MKKKNDIIWKLVWTCIIVGAFILTTINLLRTSEGQMLFNKFNFKIEQKSNIAYETGSNFGVYEEQPQTSYIKYVKPVKVKGVYLSEWTLSTSAKRKFWIDTINNTELNAIVLNVKNDDGLVTFNMDDPVVKEINSAKDAPIKDMKQFVSELRANGIYPIARIVTFKDPYLAEKRPDLAIKDKNTGGVLRIKSSSGRAEAWVNPYNKEVWEYIVNVAKQAAAAGFEEIQFDYIRFSTGRGIENADYGELANTKTKTDIINDFTKYAVSELKPLGVYVSADVFGTIINSPVDSKIVGQDYTEMSKHLDYICPMVYPSHYGNGSMGIKYPDIQPYDTVLKAMQLSEQKISVIPKGEHKAIVRPWLQDFTAPWVKPHQTYTPVQIREQKKAVYDAKLDEWILWNASNVYNLEALEK